MLCSHHVRQQTCIAECAAGWVAEHKENTQHRLNGGRGMLSPSQHDAEGIDPKLGA